MVIDTGGQKVKSAPASKSLSLVCRRIMTWLVAFIAFTTVRNTAFAQLNVLSPNDDCQFASPIAGAGSWGLDDLINATPSAVPPPQLCGFPFPATNKDIWFCWTATFSGAASVNAGTNLVQVFFGCGCPTTSSTLLACGNAGFDVQCGQQYLIRVGSANYPGSNQRFMTISMTLGQDCPPPTPQACGDCCGGKPTFTDPAYGPYSGQVAIATGNDVTNGPSNYPVVTIFNLQCSNPAPTPNGIWNPGNAGSPTNAFRYSRSNWTKSDLGSVFGLTLDGQGNIYVAHGAFYGDLQGGLGSTCTSTATSIGSLATSSSTSVYKIQSGTGTPGVFVNLPGGSNNPGDPGLGNLNYDCEHDEFFVSHFGDGRIYRVSAAGAILGWFDHATNTIGLGSAPDPAGPYTTYVPLGERVWAVQAHQGRLYYSVWGQNRNFFSNPTAVVGATPNRVWSIALATGPNGNFVANSRRQEVMPPIFPGNGSAPAASLTFSSPASDISFSPTCRMLLAERDMSIDNCTLAHCARALEYAPSGTTWLPSNFRSGRGYEIGSSGAANNVFSTNSSGGCDYDMPDPTDCVAGRLWVTADFMTLNPYAYGFTGVDPTTAFGLATAFHVDYNGVLAGTNDKTKQGDIEIPCRAGACVNFNDTRIDCQVAGTPPGLTGNFTYTFTFVNNTSPPQAIQYLFTPQNSGVTFNGSPAPGHSLALATPIAPGATSPPITVTIAGQNPGSHFCFDMTFANPRIEVCCQINHCVDLPNCDCEQFPQFDVVCRTNGNSYTVTFTIQNLFRPNGVPSPINEMHIFPLPVGSGVVATPADFYFPSTPTFGVAGRFTTVLTGAHPGSLCMRISVHLNGTLCCSDVKCVQLPACSSAAMCLGDCDHNGVVDINDLLGVIAEWGPCPDLPAICESDFEPVGGNGAIDIDDLLSVIYHWGPCP
jgi:hypothetical protein